jgi:outer membrane protein OmpA-like peptidoglycan-associated protein
LSRGRNFVMMLDETTLTKGGVLTTQNPLVKRVTWAIPVQFNFGVRQQLYKINLAQMNSEETDQEAEMMEANDSSNPMRAVPRSKIDARSFTQANQPSLVPSKKTKTYVIATDGLFQFGKSDESSIINSGGQHLQVFAEKIKAEFSTVESIVLKAHTDRIGNNEKNLLLSYQRAETIKKLIIQAGVQSKVFDLNGIGSAEPIVKCNGLNQAKTIECLAPNRRFEVVVTGEPVPPKGSP